MIATELSRPGFRQLQERLSAWPVDVRRGNGLEPILNEPIDIVVVAGLGFRSILDVVMRYSEMSSCPFFVVQPMQGALVFRHTLLERNWTIVKAQLTRYRDRFYATWMLDPYHLDKSDGLGMPNEFLDSPWYQQWLEYERRSDPG